MIIRQVKNFKNQIATLKRRYPSVELDFLHEVSSFNKNKNIALGHSIFKIRVRNSDIPCGKSGGYRVIAFYEKSKDVLLPLIIYSKRNKGNVSKSEITSSLADALKEISS